MMQKITKSASVVLAGDSFITQRLPRDAKLAALKEYLAGFDVRFTNFEILLHDFEVYPAPVSGGTWACARPAVLQDLQYLGFNLYTWANNHTIDWNLGGILTTKKHLDAAGVVHAGCGINLEEAAQPRYLDLPQGRAAIIGVTSTMSEWGMASNPRRDVLGRPGANVLRYQQIHKVLPAELETLRKIVDQTEVNANRMLLEKEGFTKPLTGGYLIGNIRFEAVEHGEKPGTVTLMNKKDAARIVRSIEEYGIFVELSPNLAGLAEPKEGLKPGQSVSVYIKAIIPDKMKIKLIIVDVCGDSSEPMPLKYYTDENKISLWQYSTASSEKDIKTVF